MKKIFPPGLQAIVNVRGARLGTRTLSRLFLLIIALSVDYDPIYNTKCDTSSKTSILQRHLW